MNPITILSLTAVLASAEAQTNPAVTQTSVATDVKDGKGTVTITVEKDGKKVTRTIVIDEHTPFQALTDQITEKLDNAGFSDPAAPPKKAVTYLGVMLNEPAGFPFAGGGAFGGGGGFGPQDGGGSSDTGGRPQPEGLPAGTGLTVTGTIAGSPAEKAGLQPGDVLAKLNDQILVNPGQFTTLIRTMKDGEAVKLSVFRQGKEQEVTATLGSRLEDPPPTTGFGGVAGLPADISRVLTIDPEGNVVESVPGSLLDQAPVPPSGDHPSPSLPPPPDVKPDAEARPLWENALREAAAAKQHAAAQWQEQLSKWRADWTENQKKATQEYRRAMEKMGEELGKAREAAEKAREDARRAIEEVMRSIEEQQKAAPPASPEVKPDAPEPESPKHT